MMTLKRLKDSYVRTMCLAFVKFVYLNYVKAVYRLCTQKAKKVKVLIKKANFFDQYENSSCN